MISISRSQLFDQIERAVDHHAGGSCVMITILCVNRNEYVSTLRHLGAVPVEIARYTKPKPNGICVANIETLKFPWIVSVQWKP